MQNNPLLLDPKAYGPFEAFPFTQLKLEHHLPAIDTALTEAREDVARLKKSLSLKPNPTFEDVMIPLETAGDTLGRVTSVFFNLLSAHGNDEMHQMAKSISPKLAEFHNDITLDPTLFAGVRSVWDRREQLNLSGEELRLAEKTFIRFRRNGALLNEADKLRLREIDRVLAELSPLFSENVLKATNAFQLHLTDPADVKGLPESALEAAVEASKEAGLQGGWLFTLQGPSYIALMTYCSRRENREKVWRAYNSRAFSGEVSNQETVLKMVSLRHERAQLLGYPTHAHFVLEERMAETPDKVMGFLKRLAERGRPAALRDVQEVAELAKADGVVKLMPWDYPYYAEKLKQKKLDLDEELLRPYFKLENVIDGAFEHARRLYGLKFIMRSEVPTYHPDVRTYEVREESSDRFIGLLYADFFPRKEKQSGAWMTAFREQGLQRGEVKRPHIAIVCNFTKPTPDKPSLLTHDEVQTLFHEFGHALHGLLSDCRYVSLGGTNVDWDFVELPSQIMENWTNEPEGLAVFARHYKDNSALPSELVDKLRAVQRFQSGYAMMRQVGFSQLDMAWHSADPRSAASVVDFEAQALADSRLFDPVPGTSISTSFGHIFSGGYSAGYYSYKWAEVLDADAFEAFKERGLFDRQTGESFKREILSKGGTEKPMALYRRFRGREPDPDALLRRSGLL
jgi:peptidyl-dipeptidase Dcp